MPHCVIQVCKRVNGGRPYRPESHEMSLGNLDCIGDVSVQTEWCVVQE